MKHYLWLLLLLALSGWLPAQTVVNGGRVYLGNQDASQAQATSPMKSGRGVPAGVCVAGQQYFQLDAVPGANLWGCAPSGWALQAGSTANPGAPSLTAHTNQFYGGFGYDYPHVNPTPTIEWFMSDGSNSEPGWTSAQLGALYRGWFFNTHNWQSQGKDTIGYRNFQVAVGAGQTNLMFMTLDKNGPGDGALIDGHANCRYPTNTAGDEGCTAMRAQMNGVVDIQNYSAGVRAYSTCRATLQQAAVMNGSVITNDPASTTGVIAQTIKVDNASSCKVGDWVAFGLPAKLQYENASAQQDGFDMETLQLTGVDTVNNTLTAFFKGSHPVGTIVAGASTITSPDVTSFDIGVNTKTLLVNTTAAKQVRPASCTMSQVSLNSTSFAIDPGCPYTLSGGAFGGSANFPGMCLALDQYYAWNQDGHIQPWWQQVQSIDSTTQLTIVGVNSTPPANHSAFTLAPCTSVEAVELAVGAFNTPAHVGKMVLYPQPLSTVGGINYDFVRGDSMASAVGSPYMSGINTIITSGYPEQNVYGMRVVATGMGKVTGLGFGGTSPAPSPNTGTFTNATTLTINPVWNPFKSKQYFYSTAAWGTNPVVNGATTYGGTTVSLRNLGMGTLNAGDIIRINGIFMMLASSATITANTATVTVTAPIPTAFNDGNSVQVAKTTPLATQPTCYPGSGTSGPPNNPAVSLTCTFPSPATGSYAVFYEFPQFGSTIDQESTYSGAAIKISGVGVPDLHANDGDWAPAAMQLDVHPFYDFTGQSFGTSNSCDGKDIQWAGAVQQFASGAEYHLGVDCQDRWGLRIYKGGSYAFQVDPASFTFHMYTPQTDPRASDPGCRADSDRGKEWFDASGGDDVIRRCMRVGGTIAWRVMSHQ